MKKYNKTAIVFLIILSLFITSCSSFNTEKTVTVTSEPAQKPTVSTEKQTRAQTAAKPEKTVAKKPKTDKLLIAHRGFSGVYPESTAEAFNGAFISGFDGVECDVWESKNGDFLIHHDPTIKRTTGQKKYIWSINSKSRDKYPISKGDNVERFNSVKLVIPTLSEVLEIVKKHNGYLWLHIKNYKDDKKYSLSEKGQKKIINLLKKYKLEKRTLIFGGKKYIKPFLNKGFKTGIFFAPKSKKQVKATARWCKKNGVNTIVFSNMKRFKIFGKGKKLSSFLKKKNLKFGVYKTETKKAYSYLCRIGAWFSMSNFNIR